ncbi:hypothetical protein ES708_30321 [subsurface metagenome]
MFDDPIPVNGNLHLSAGKRPVGILTITGRCLPSLQKIGRVAPLLNGFPSQVEVVLVKKHLSVVYDARLAADIEPRLFPFKNILAALYEYIPLGCRFILQPVKYDIIGLNEPALKRNNNIAAGLIRLGITVICQTIRFYIHTLRHIRHRGKGKVPAQKQGQ